LKKLESSRYGIMVASFQQEEKRCERARPVEERGWLLDKGRQMKKAQTL